ILQPTRLGVYPASVRVLAQANCIYDFATPVTCGLARCAWRVFRRCHGPSKGKIVVVQTRLAEARVLVHATIFSEPCQSCRDANVSARDARQPEPFERMRGQMPGTWSLQL